MQLHIEVTTQNIVIEGLEWDEREPEWRRVLFEGVELVPGVDYDESELANELIEESKPC